MSSLNLSNSIVFLITTTLIFCFGLLPSSLVLGERDAGNPNKCLEIETGEVRSSSSCGQEEFAEASFPRVPNSCELVLAETRRHHWAAYTMVPRKKGTPVRQFGDIVIQWTDPLHEKRWDEDHPTEWNRILLKDFTWNGQETGGQYEGRTRVESVVPGFGMISRATIGSGNHNILPLVPRVDEGGLTRFESPGAGAITHYHNYTWWYLQDVEAGDELVYSSKGKGLLYPEQAANRTTEEVSAVDGLLPPERPSQDFLKHNGYCIDNLLARTSRIKDAGRGAFATRSLPQGSIVAPVPVAIVKREDLVDTRNGDKNKQQLLMNYCWGHKASSWLFFPYSPTVNLINHYHEPNVKLQWSSRTTTSPENLLSKTLDSKNISTTGLLFELVAVRSIQEGEEIYLDYGKAWEDAWWHHVNSIWKPINRHYSPSYVMDDAIRLLRTEQEQKEHPYRDNLFTSCFYRYSDRTIEDRETAKASNNEGSSALTSFRWRLTKGLYDMKNLRPCQVLKRVEDSKSGRSTYAVRMLNRPYLDSMDPSEIIPTGELHIVTHVPRAAIRFMDKAGTTDPHLLHAFRHEIGLADELVPAAWRDLEKEEVTSVRA